MASFCWDTAVQNLLYRIDGSVSSVTLRTDIVTRLVDEQSRGMEDDVGKQHISSVDFMRSQKVTYARYNTVAFANSSVNLQFLF